jgi:hypothetical protein
MFFPYLFCSRVKMKNVIKCRYWLCIAMCLVVSACAGGGSAGGSSLAPTPETDPFKGPLGALSGNYTLSYSGTRQGNCNVQVLGDGRVLGQCVNETDLLEALCNCVSIPGQTDELLGTVTTDGRFVSNLGSATKTGDLKGKVTPDKAGVGTWSTTEGKNGSWSMSLASASVSPPDLANPGAGASVLVGNGLEGIWRNASGEPLFITETNTLFLAPRDPALDTVVATITSALVGKGGSFELNTDALGLSTSGVNALSGAASFTRVSTLGLSYKRIVGTGPVGDYSGRYDTANALAVSQGDVVGEWGSSIAPDFTLAADGALTVRTTDKTLGYCLLVGTVTQAAPGTRKNLFRVSLTAGPAPNAPAGAFCKALPGAAYSGYAFIGAVNVSSTAAPFYKQSVELFVNQGAAGSIALSVNRK